MLDSLVYFVISSTGAGAMARITDADKKRPTKKKPASPDSVIKGAKAGAAELSEDELKDVSGGTYLKLGHKE
jgi:hypothetical protein